MLELVLRPLWLEVRCDHANGASVRETVRSPHCRFQVIVVFV